MDEKGITTLWMLHEIKDYSLAAKSIHFSFHCLLKKGSVCI